MVTRKVARSKRDALALAEAKQHESESEDEQEKKAAGQLGRRRGAAAKLKLKAKEKETESPEPAAGKTRRARATSPVRAPEPAKQPAEKAMKKSVSIRVDVAHAAAPAAPSQDTPRGSIGTRNGGSRRSTPTSAGVAVGSGVSPAALMRAELEYKLDQLDPKIKERFGQLVWAKRAAFPYWPALILDPQLLPDHQLPSALKELDEKCWVQLYGSRDIRQMLFSAIVPWEETKHPYRDGFPRSDFNRIARLKDTFKVALQEASDQEKLTPEERLKVFTVGPNEVVPSLGLPIPAPVPGIRKRRKVVVAAKPPTSPTESTSQPSVIGESSSTAVPSDIQHADAMAAHVAPRSNQTKHNRVSDSVPKTAEVVPPASTRDSSLERQRRLETTRRVMQDLRGESESRYRLGDLTSFMLALRSMVDTNSSTNDWRVQLQLSQLLDEKAFLRQDLERAGVWDLLDLLRAANDDSLSVLVDTVQTHLNNCTLEEWPTARATPTSSLLGGKRQPNIHLRGQPRAESDPKRYRLSAVPARTSTVAGRNASSAEEMAEAVARSLLSRSMPPPSTVALAGYPGVFSPPGNVIPGMVGASIPIESSANPTVASYAQLGTMFVQRAMANMASLNPGQPGINVSAATPAGSSVHQLQTSDSSRANGSHQAFGQIDPSTVNGVTSAMPSPVMGSAPSLMSVQVRTNPSLVIFNKDGTLLDFQTTWIFWLESQAWRLETALGRPIRDAFYDAVGYNWKSRTIRKGSMFSTCAKHDLGQKIANEFLVGQGLTRIDAARLISQHWSLPKDVVTYRARRDLVSLFNSIRELGVKIAIVTSDRRDVTLKTLLHLGIQDLVDHVSCGDDGMANSPERIWTMCSRLGVSAANTIMVGDTADDMAISRSAGCALSIGVLGGAADLSDLSTEADFLVPCVTNVVKVLFQYRQKSAFG